MRGPGHGTLVGMETHTQRIARVAQLLLHRHQRLAGESHDAAVYRALAAKELVTVVQGTYMRSEQWQTLLFEERLLARTLAAVARAHYHGLTPSVCSHLSAAVLWGLPLFRVDPHERVHMLTLPRHRSKSSADVHRHAVKWSDDDVTTLSGVRVTTLDRTIIDLARTAPAEVAMGCADAGVRRLLGITRDGSMTRLPDAGAGAVEADGDWRAATSSWRARVEAQLCQYGHCPGINAARDIIALVDPRSDSVAESVSRLQLSRLGVPYDIQVRVAGLEGRQYWMDFELLGEQAFGEMDGKGKYLKAEAKSQGGAVRSVLAEKAREDEVRGMTGKRIVRWGFDDITSARRLGQRLQKFGLTVPALSGVSSPG